MSGLELVRDPDIVEAEVMRGETARPGSRVKHFGQRWTACATATVVGFRLARPEEGYIPSRWIKVLVKPDRATAYGVEWDWDRTEVVGEPGIPVQEDNHAA